MNATRIPLAVDHRELSGKNKKILLAQSDVFELHFSNLPLGDYILNNDLIIERKTLTDFIYSIKNGRLFRQAYNIVDSQMPVIMILEGNKQDVANSKMKRKALLGVFVHISAILGIPIIRSKDYYETLYLLKSISNQLTLLPHPQKINLNQKKLKYDTTLEKHKIQLLQMIPGMGTKRAMALLNKFGSIKNIATTDINKICTIKGIGKKLAHNIKSILNE